MIAFNEFLVNEYAIPLCWNVKYEPLFDELNIKYEKIVDPRYQQGNGTCYVNFKLC